MKSEALFEVFSDIDEELITEARGFHFANGRKAWVKGFCVAACVLMGVVAGVLVLLPLIQAQSSSLPFTEEGQLVQVYSFNVEEGDYSGYEEGKVIAKERLGNKLSEVFVKAGWKNGDGEWSAFERLRGEVYSINGVKNEIAVALRFIDKGEGISTVHYYVLINPLGNAEGVEEYIRDDVIGDIVDKDVGESIDPE